MNPELRRNIWLELTTGRLIAMPVVLGILFSLPAGIGAGTSTLATILFFILTLIWGTRQAAEAVPSEVSENTWDWQRLSTLSAFQLTWGKLFGATLFTWYGGLMCLLVLLSEGAGIRGLAHLIGAGLIAQGVAFLTGLQTVRVRGYRAASGSLMAQLIGIFAGVLALQIGAAAKLGTIWSFAVSLGASTGVTWYGFDFAADPFTTLSLFIFLAWTLLACYRLMMRELQYKARPWAWPAFVVFCCFYGAGFVSVATDL
ncbi:MAG: hypothetical protein O2910_01960, partial [Proteobacteria bacterium]|nr:hypothetical protein [Pseudomonadota bacterium]